MDFELLAGGEREKLEQARGVFAEEGIVRDGQSAAVENEARKPLRPAADGRKREAEALPTELLVELREENCMKRSTADFPGRSA